MAPRVDEHRNGGEVTPSQRPFHDGRPNVSSCKVLISFSLFPQFNPQRTRRDTCEGDAQMNYSLHLHTAKIMFAVFFEIATRNFDPSLLKQHKESEKASL
jgi:hypothetical protein